MKTNASIALKLNFNSEFVLVSYFLQGKGHYLDTVQSCMLLKSNLSVTKLWRATNKTILDESSYGYLALGKAYCFSFEDN